MTYVRFPPSLMNVEGFLYERGVDVSYEPLRFRWHGFGPLFSAEIRKRRVEGIRSSHWTWHPEYRYSAQLADWSVFRGVRSFVAFLLQALKKSD